MATNTKINGQDYYRIRRTVGYTYKDGKKSPVIKNFYGTSKGNAEEQYKKYLEEETRKKYDKEYSLDISTLDMRAKDFIDNSLSVSSKFAASTKRRYKSSYYCHIQGTWLDKMVVKDIRPTDLQKFYNELDVSMATIKHIQRFMAAFYKWMVKNDYATNVLSAIDLPVKKDTKKSEDIVVWDDKSWKVLTSRNFSFRHDLLIKLLCYSGMRIGEALALKYGDIRDDTIHIVRQYSEGEIKAPKRNSKRNVPMHKNVKSALTKHEEWHMKEMKEKGYTTDFIFTTPQGTLYDHSNLYKAFKRFYKEQGLPEQHFHVYRATFCTKLCEAEVPIEVASKLLGHKSLEVTAAHYALVRKAPQENAINKLK